MMQAEIDELKSKLNAINKGNVNPSQLEDDLLKKSKLGENVLYQNQPNPFKETSTINYFIANNASLAYIYIFDLRGAMLKSIKIDQFGNGNIKLTGGDLKAGMYLYSLIVDGEEIDTKRMILLD